MEKPLSDELAVAPSDVKITLPDLLPLDLPAEETAKYSFYLIIGCNLGDRLSQLSRAKELLGSHAGSLITESHIYETQPWGYDDQPWFLNQVIQLDSNLDPITLLTRCKDLEKQIGRQPAEKWHARHMDIDILLCADMIFNDERLQIPHPELQDRNFVLVPLMEIAPLLLHPVTGKTIEELYLDCRDTGEVYIFNADEQVDPL